MTGSVNQWGEVQAIGGVNEKIEGFHDVCRVVGLTREQGVLIPESNIRHLVLRSDVSQAVAEGKFHIYPVRTIDDGLAILTGMTADGGSGERNVNHAVTKRLKELALGLKEFAVTGRDGRGRTKALRKGHHLHKMQTGGTEFSPAYRAAKNGPFCLILWQFIAICLFALSVVYMMQ